MPSSLIGEPLGLRIWFPILGRPCWCSRRSIEPLAPRSLLVPLRLAALSWHFRDGNGEALRRAPSSCSGRLVASSFRRSFGFRLTGMLSLLALGTGRCSPGALVAGAVEIVARSTIGVACWIGRSRPFAFSRCKPH